MGVRTLLVHLRLPFQLLLAPIFLWGWLLAGGGLSAAVLVAFVAFHVFLYGGATAFNSAYDRDVGPVGGLEEPPPVPPSLLPFSLAIKAIGWGLAWLVNGTFFAIYAGFALLSLAYSHPSVRLKAHPVRSLMTVAFGQGVLAFLGAWAAVRGEAGSVLRESSGLLGALAATFIVLGLYPLTQLYQADEDRARGDRTPVVAWGASRSFQLALACEVLGGLALIAVLLQRYGVLDAVVVAAGLLVQVSLLALWAGRFEPARIIANYRRVMRLSTASAVGLGGYFLVRLALG